MVNKEVLNYCSHKNKRYCPSLLWMGYALHKEYSDARRKNANNYDYNINSILVTKDSLPSNLSLLHNRLVTTSIALAFISNSAEFKSS